MHVCLVAHVRTQVDPKRRAAAADVLRHPWCSTGAAAAAAAAAEGGGGAQEKENKSANVLGDVYGRERDVGGAESGDGVCNGETRGQRLAPGIYV